ncbi:Fe-S cluster assembly protein SufD [Pelagibacteraceae bacterium]|nr:Fe-S cluster assembly protein SufD [Pelagibacteraceae bacterium]
MKQSYDFSIKNIKNISDEEKNIRQKNLDLFLKTGFPTKTIEEWKFSDLNSILNKNFKSISNSQELNPDKKLEIIKDFDHNYIFLINGKLNSSNFNYEDNSQILIKDYTEKNGMKLDTNTSLHFLNNALFSGGFYLEVKKNYKFKKPLIVYNYFLDNLKNIILNDKNIIKLEESSQLTLIEYNLNKARINFIKNTEDTVSLDKNANLKNIIIQNSKNDGHFYKYQKVFLLENSKYENYNLSSGLKFNKIEIDADLNKEHSICNVYSALNLAKDEHQEILTRINHKAPHCQSYQKIKNVLNANSKGVYQGKIFVEKLAQKTDAYQLSKALILSDEAEFDAKPELEIYADDVKCSHGSTSGSIDDESIHYLMTRGLPREKAVKLLINGFLNEILETIDNTEIKFFLEKKLESQINDN